MAKFAHDTIVPDAQSGLEKKEQVAQMFDNIAFRYDFLNRFLSLGNDVRWRKEAIMQLKKLHPEVVLDVATGTGDLALMCFRMLQPRMIIGIDISDGMLELGRKKIRQVGLRGLIDLQQGNSETIHFPDSYFDAVTVAFGVRNFQHLEKGLSEMLRVLKPGGKLVVLEFSRPKNPVFKMLCNFYMNVVGPGIGKLVAKNKEAYQYLNESVQAFPEREAFINIMGQTGFVKTYFKPLSLGICCIYCGSK
jgi:demethylmenaquinone methyltransferase/2-methoxy-6-polyprenyl-1,4-benzoquinol methylase